MVQTDARMMDTDDRLPVASVAVCGAGTMGAGIAQVFASRGSAVMLYDSVPGATERGLGRIEHDLATAVERGKVDPAAAEVTMRRIDVVEDLERLSPADLVVEAVVEDLQVKQALFESLEKICSEESLLVTNTSTLSPTEIASVLADPGRSAGVHFFNPPTRMRLVELIPGQTTRPGTTQLLRDWLQATGKHVVLVNESPGGIVSRLQLLVRNEAARMLAEGVASAEDIDAAMRLGAGWPLGPLELIDLVGVDMHVNNCESLARELGSNRYAPHPLVRKLMRAGQLGRKTGQGFYAYGSEGGGTKASARDHCG